MCFLKNIHLICSLWNEKLLLNPGMHKGDHPEFWNISSVKNNNKNLINNILSHYPKSSKKGMKITPKHFLWNFDSPWNFFNMFFFSLRIFYSLRIKGLLFYFILCLPYISNFVPCQFLL